MSWARDAVAPGPGPGGLGAPSAVSARSLTGAGPAARGPSLDVGAAVVVDGLVKHYGARAALDGMVLRAERGAVTAVLGPNGAGKTTTVECCTGLRTPDAGTVRVLGLDPAREGAALRSRVGVVLQDGGLPNGAPAMRVLRHVAALHADPLDVDALAALLGVDAFARTSVRRLSGGQRQRLALAAAVVGRPELLFLDEPSAGLDPAGRQVVWALLADLRAAGVAIVLTTHSMAETERLADAVVVVRDGRAVATGTVEELTGGSGTDQVRFSTRPHLDLSALRAALPTTVRAAELSPGRYEVLGLVPGAVDPQVVVTVTSWCAAHSAMPHGLSVGRRSLEEVVLELTGGVDRSWEVAP